MANIQPFLDNIANAVYGEEVRSSIYDAIFAINVYTEEAVSEMRDYNSELDSAIDGFETWFQELDAYLEPDVAAHLAYEVLNLNYLTRYNRNILYRGQKLGEKPTTEQLEAIRSGSFDNIWLGDYWEFNNIRLVIYDFDYYITRNYDNSGKIGHHVVVIPDTSLYAGGKPMFGSYSSGSQKGYAFSTMNTQYLPEIASQFESAGFPIISFPVTLAGVITSTSVNTLTNTRVKAVLPSEMNFFGYQNSSLERYANENKINETMFKLCFVRPESRFLKKTLSDGTSAEANDPKPGWLREVYLYVAGSEMEQQLMYEVVNADYGYIQAESWNYPRAVRPIFCFG